MSAIVEKHRDRIEQLAKNTLADMLLVTGPLPEVERRAVVIGALATAVNITIADAKQRDPRFGELVEATFARNINLAIVGEFDEAAE
ncbi:hypothetical protein B0E33_01610 [Roseibium algicola]|uniref:Uncharacterized protein n=1 Tax=Roseibium algicola TaxID=2857014 RepID=A0ABM6HWM3_9HYPH|nr:MULTISPECIES: hypothetical protein [Stappiaceae]AQQ02449.1 hypothetical protein B0E33_01610 [Roseibium aggregatum]NKI61807.1 hypothetical protein [Labrenzia sp. PO1]